MQRSSVTIEMQTMSDPMKRRTTIVLCLLKYFPRDVCSVILRRTSSHVVGCGKSRYARRRRAKSIGRCERCYRVFPPTYMSKCDNRTCRPGISSNQRVVNYIEHGVTEVIP